MIYRKFYVIVIVRILFILATSIWFSEALRTPSNLYSLIVVSVLLIFQTISLIKAINSMNKSISRFFDGIQEIGSSVRPHFKVKDASFTDLSKSIGKVAHLIQETRMRAEKQLQYFEFVVENSPVGILIINQDGVIQQYNKAAREIFGIEKIFSLSDLGRIVPDFTREIEKMELGSQKTVKLKINNVFAYLLAQVTGINSENTQLRIISIQNVTRELEENELLSWQKLTRVLTHEIMNSITPIASLTAATKKCLSKEGKPKDIGNMDNESIADAIFNIDLIEERSIGIKNFVNSYKRISQVPAINLSKVVLNDVIRRNVLGFNSEFTNNNIKLIEEYDDNTGEIELDEKLIGQVFTNFFRNSIEAMSGSKEKIIRISSGQESGNRWMEVSDTGQGIPPEEIENIFMPFYTTKSEGMGIGLSLSRQIMRLHKGNIMVQSEPGKETKFKLIF